jgi:hypothetical protein
MDHEKKSPSVVDKLSLYFFYCFIGTLATVYIQAIGCNPIVASSLVGIIISFFTITIGDENRFSYAAFCGSFAGMILLGDVSAAHWQSWGFFAGAVGLSMVASFIYVVIEYVSVRYPRMLFDGYGGKLGATAFIAVLAFIGMRNLLAPPVSIFTGTGFLEDAGWHWLLVILSAVLGSLISMEIKNTVSSLNDNYKVLTVSITGIIGGILVTRFSGFGEGFGIDLGNAWYAGAFVGMSSYFILVLRRDYLVAGIFSGVLYLAGRPLFVGVGGKLGFIAFLSVLMMRSIFWTNAKLGYWRQRAPGRYDGGTAAVGGGEEVFLCDGALMSSPDSGDGEPVENLELVPPNLKEFIEKLHFIDISHWIYFHKMTDIYTPVSYQGISIGSLNNLLFHVKSILVRVLNREKRVLGFWAEGLRQEFFTSRFSTDDLAGIRVLIVAPVWEYGKLQGFFMLLDKNASAQVTANNFKRIRQFFSSEFGTSDFH